MESQQDRPTCPVCQQLIPRGSSIIREDNVAVHVECFDGVRRWRPGEDFAPGESGCMFCHKRIHDTESVVKGGGRVAHFACWVRFDVGRSKRQPAA